MTIRSQSVVPSSNLLICTNEHIRDLKVEGRNKDEVYKKISVVDLGETPMSSANGEFKAERRKDIMTLAVNLRNVLPSFMGLMLQVCHPFITNEEFKSYEDITKHERLGNILKNARKLQQKLDMYCDSRGIEKPKCLNNELDTSCLTNKSALVNRLKSTDQVVDYLLKINEKMVLTNHENQEGIAFDPRNLKSMPWFKDTFKVEVNGVKVYQKMRTRQLGEKAEIRAIFLGFQYLKNESIENVKEFIAKNDDVALQEDVEEAIVEEFHVNATEEAIFEEFHVNDTENVQLLQGEALVYSSVVQLTDIINEECLYNANLRNDRCRVVDRYIEKIVNIVQETAIKRQQCPHCKFVAKSKGGLTNHMKSCRKKK